MPNTPLTVLLDIHTAEIKRQVRHTLQDFSGVAVREQAQGGRGNLLITELNSAPEQEFQAIQTALDSGSVDEVFLLAADAQPEILLRSIKLGIREFFLLPLQEEELRTALHKITATRERKTAPEAPTPNGRLVTVIGSRGGAGTTTVAVNLAAALAEQSPAHSVLLVDLDVYLGEIPLFLDFKPQYSWADLAANLSRVDDSFLRNVLYQHPNGMFVLPGPDATQGSLPAFLDVFGRVLELLRRMFDVVVIDAGQTVTELVQRTLGQSDTVLVVSQLSLPHLASTNKLMGVLRRLVAEPETSIHTVFNRYHKKSNISVHEAEQSLKSSISSTLQNDYQFVMSAMNQGQVFSQAGARHKLTKQMQQLAQAIIPESATAPAGKKKWFSK